MKSGLFQTQVITMVFSLSLLHGVLPKQDFAQVERVIALQTPVLISKAKSDGTSENNRAGKTGGNGGTRNTDNTNRVGGSGKEDGTNRVNGVKRGDGTNAPASTPGVTKANDGTSGVQNQRVNIAPKGDGTGGTSKGDGTN
jgi:hypothetical protein